MIFSRSFIALMVTAVASTAAIDTTPTQHRDLQSNSEPNGICTDSAVATKFNDVPNNGVRTLANTCPVGEILLTFECITGGGGLTSFEVGGGQGITFDDDGGKVFKQLVQETKLIEGTAPDGRRVALGVNCGMVHDNSELAITKKDATLVTKITCGKPEDFPDVTLDKTAERKSRVPGGKNRSTTNTCPGGTEIFETTCNVGGRGSFEFRSQATSADSHRCTFKNSSATKKTATITTSTICGDFDRAEQLCDL
mmetsp:Transcript_49435/g.119939  ORF Transcript_49435/g.119939 Transcript_49435/m.119939 type:complete len:253 (-) Transcript_49435:226-984(-)